MPPRTSEAASWVRIVRWRRSAAELVRERERLRAAFGDAFLPVLVPPWNRIAPEVVGLARGRWAIAGCRRSRRAASALAAPGVVQCNTHVDPIAWRRGRVFVGEDQAAAGLAAHLALRRQTRVDPAEPTGLLTHHLDFDDAAWRFVERLARRRPRGRIRRGATWVSGMSTPFESMRLDVRVRLLPADQHEPPIALVRLHAGEQLFAQRRLRAERVEVGYAVHMIGDRVIVVRLQDQQLPGGYAGVPLPRSPTTCSQDVLISRSGGLAATVAGE